MGMENSEESMRSEITEADVEAATRSALGPDAVVERFEIGTNGSGIGLVGAHFLLTVHARPGPDLPVEPVEMFVKVETTDVDLCRSFLSFETEGSFYQNLQPALRAAIRSPDGEDVPDWCPKCYLVRGNVIIVANMVAAGYRSVGNWVSEHLTMEHYRQVARVLARFHAAGLLFAEKEGREAALEVCPELKADVFASNDYKLGGVLVRNAAVDSFASILPYLLEDTSPESLKEAHEKLIKLSQSLWNCLDESKIGPLVPCHGDCHPDNYLFKFDEEGNPTEAVIIDFQLMRFNVPGLDLTLFIYVSSSEEFRENHKDEIYRYYYDCLKEETAKCGLDLEAILTFDDLLAGAERVKKFAVFIATLYTGILYAPRTDLIKIMSDAFHFQRFMLGARSGETVRWFRSDPFFRERLGNLVKILLDS